MFKLCRRDGIRVISVYTQLHFLPSTTVWAEFIERGRDTRQRQQQQPAKSVHSIAEAFSIELPPLAQHQTVFGFCRIPSFTTVSVGAIWWHSIFAFRRKTTDATAQNTINVVSSFNEKINCFQTINKFSGAPVPPKQRNTVHEEQWTIDCWLPPWHDDEGELCLSSEIIFQLENCFGPAKLDTRLLSRAAIVEVYSAHSIDFFAFPFRHQTISRLRVQFYLCENTHRNKFNKLSKLFSFVG